MNHVYKLYDIKRNKQFSVLNPSNFKSVANYAFIVYCLVWDAIRVFFVSVDGYGRLGMLLLFIAIFANFNHNDVWKRFKIPAISIWLVWVIVEWIRWYDAGILWEGNPDKWYFTYYNFIRCFAAMLISAVEMYRNRRRFLRIVLGAFLVYVSLGIVLQMSFGQSLRTEDDGGNLLGNMLPLASLGMVATGMIGYCMAGIKKRTVILLFVISAMTILACATRKASGGFFILFIAWYISVSNLKSAKNVFLLIIGAIVAYSALGYVMDNTMIGERMQSIEEQSQGYQDNIFLKMMGDRAVQYMLGWGLFLKHPLWGVGLLNFQHYTQWPWQLHSEYMVQLAECGIVGTFIYLCFIISVFRGIIRIRKNYKRLSKIFLGWMCCVLFLSFTAWNFNMPFYFIIYGIVIGGYNLLGKRLSSKESEL